MNKLQWNAWGAIFLLLGLTLMMVHITMSKEFDSLTWLVGRMYFLAIWVFFGIAFGCIASAYYHDFREGSKAPMKSARRSPRARSKRR